MKVIGFIGGVCSGKTTACKILEQMGVTIINADKLTHSAYLPGTNCYNQVVATFWL